eukprot:924220-Lingulodinium_polyedra.AAC.1
MEVGLSLGGPEAWAAPSGRAFTDGACLRGQDVRLRRAGFGFTVFGPDGALLLTGSGPVVGPVQD